MSRTLTCLGFSVITKTNINEQEFEEAIDEFARKIEGADVALFYFSGHGCQARGENYLIPVGYNLQSETDVRHKAIKAAMVLGRMEEAKSKINIMILDACRDNSFKGLRAQGGGLTVIEAPAGTFIAYATAPGSVAEDTPYQRNGVYTKHLLRALEIQGLDVDKAFRIVLREVKEETKGQQIPWVSSSLDREFLLQSVPRSLSRSDCALSASGSSGIIRRVVKFTEKGRGWRLESAI